MEKILEIITSKIEKSFDSEKPKYAITLEDIGEIAKEISEHYYPKEFVHYLLTQTNYPLLFAKISKEKTEEHFIYYQNNHLKEFIEWRDKNCKRLQNGNWMQKYKHKSKTSNELYEYWSNLSEEEK